VGTCTSPTKKREVEISNVTERNERQRIVVLTGDPIGEKMAGPAIRAWNVAMALSLENEIKLVSYSRADPVDAPFEIHVVPPGDDLHFRKFERWADIIVFQGHALEYFGSLRTSSKFVVADVYAPMQLEQLEQARELSPRVWAETVRYATASMNGQLARCDFFLCASERQRQLYIGQLSALGRVNVANYDGDPELSSLLAVVPFGLDETPPKHVRNALRGVHPSIAKNDKIILWGGGLYSWFDPKTLIRAVAQLAKRHPNVRLLFQGIQHPNPGVPEMEVVADSRELARSLGVYGTNVIFNESWVDYTDRQNYLLEADIGVSTHFEHVETTFSFRTRILDYLWATLPMVVTRGDAFADLIDRENLGIVVPEKDPDALEDALEKALFDTKYSAQARRNIQRVRERFFWSTVLEPLLAYARAPHHSGDFAANRRRVSARSIPWNRHGVTGDSRKVLRYLRSEGPGVTLKKSWQAVRRRMGLARER